MYGKRICNQKKMTELKPKTEFPKWAAILEAIAMFLMADIASDWWLHSRRDEVKATSVNELFEPLTT